MDIESQYYISSFKNIKCEQQIESSNSIVEMSIASNNLIESYLNEKLIKSKLKNKDFEVIQKPSGNLIIIKNSKKNNKYLNHYIKSLQEILIKNYKTDLDITYYYNSDFSETLSSSFSNLPFQCPSILNLDKNVFLVSFIYLDFNDVVYQNIVGYIQKSPINIYQRIKLGNENTFKEGNYIIKFKTYLGEKIVY